MADDKLRMMLEEAQQKRASADATEKADRARRVEETKQSGEALRERVLPRLQAAKDEWRGQLELTITDNSAQFDVLSSGHRFYPSISVSATSKSGSSSFKFEAYSPGHVAIKDRKDDSAYEFSFSTGALENLTDDKIDEVLKTIAREAFGVGKKR